MSKHMRVLKTIIAASAALAMAPALQAQDSQTDNTQEEQTQPQDTQTNDAQNDETQNDNTLPRKQAKREDYKSPPSPELLAQQNQFIISRSSALTSSIQSLPSALTRSSSSLSTQATVMPADKREPREMPF